MHTFLYLLKEGELLPSIFLKMAFNATTIYKLGIDWVV